MSDPSDSPIPSTPPGLPGTLPSEPEEDMGELFDPVALAAIGIPPVGHEDGHEPEPPPLPAPALPPTDDEPHALPIVHLVEPRQAKGRGRGRGRSKSRGLALTPGRQASTAMELLVHLVLG